ncbi:coiled-coil domain-containing protein 69 isoform X3 [Aquila chrysaetos chrysaetos]|uniref:coiled-coil domain-containing protein 69 isoform X3 n=1 Tax=Aquila chrysaetos chrysaetos TaxID=223781 RepID=UPI0011771886|nr:coiled-coil domain-containing protein 69 isoform X3 [Aquila chrysaetos chrysaetos]
MGCTGSALRCCPAGGKRQLKAQQQREPASQELTALKTENANATLLPEDGKEKAALREERAESTRLLRGQEEEEEKRLWDASRAGTVRITQDINNQETIQVLNSQLKSFQERMKRVEESLLSTDYKKHIQEHGSPSPFWEQELESLHFVIEMKNEHIHSLDKKLLNLETVVERNLLLEEKVKTLQQENEDLQVRTQNHLVMARQLSEELLAARGALEKEAQLREQARREKEELLYRVLNGGDGTPFPIAASEVPLIAT